MLSPMLSVNRELNTPVTHGIAHDFSTFIVFLKRRRATICATTLLPSGRIPACPVRVLNVDSHFLLDKPQIRIDGRHVDIQLPARRCNASRKLSQMLSYIW